MVGYKSFKSIILTVTIILCTLQLIQAQDYNQSVGARLGTYVSGSFTTFTSEHKSIEVIVGITRQANQTDYIFGGYYKFHLAFSSDIPTLNWYSGAGVLLFLEEEIGSEKVNVAVSAITGLEYTIEHSPVNFFIDASPYYKFTSKLDSKFDLHANLGVRYIINQK